MRLRRTLLAAAAALTLGACTEIPLRTDGAAAGLPEDSATQKNLQALGYAIGLYVGDHQGLLPSDLSALAPAYIAAIPDDGSTGANRQVEAYDGSGGWVYGRDDGRICPNLPGLAPDGRPWRLTCTEVKKPHP